MIVHATRTDEEVTDVGAAGDSDDGGLEASTGTLNECVGLFMQSIDKSLT